MADTKITDFTAASSVNDADVTALVQSGVNLKLPMSVLATYIYQKKFIGTDFVVATYADLPSAASNSGKLAYVQTTTGSVLTLSRKTNGFYRSNGSTWSTEDVPYRDAASIFFDSTGLTNFSADDLQEALSELDPIISAKQAALSGASLTAVTVATNDKVLIQDTSDSNNLKTVTAQSIADLAAGGSPGGSNKQMQFNQSSVFAGAEIYYDAVNQRQGIQNSSPEAAQDVTSAVAQTIGNPASASISPDTFTVIGDVSGSTATQALGRLMRPTNLTATINLTGTAFTEATGAKTYNLYSKGTGGKFSQLFATVTTANIQMPPTPTTFGGTANTGVTGFNPGDVVDYQLYAYKTIGGTVFYTPTGASVSGLTDGGSTFGCDLSWDDMSMEGYVLLRQVNAGGFVNGIDLGNVLTYQDTGFTNTSTTVTPNTITYSWDLAWSASPNGALSYQLINGGRGLNVGNVTSYTDDGFADTDTTVTPTLTDFVANGTTYNFTASGYASSPSGVTYYSTTPEAYSMTDDSSGETFTIDHSIGTVAGVTGYKIVWTEGSNSYSQVGTTFSQYSGLFAGNTTLTPIASDVGFLSDGANLNQTLSAYAYVTISGHTIYSATPATATPITDGNDGLRYKITYACAAVTGADGYKFVRSINGGGAQGVTSATNSYVSDSLDSWAAGTTVTPTSFLAPTQRLVKEASSFTADEPQQILKTTGTHSFKEFRNSSDALMGILGFTATTGIFGLNSTSPAFSFTNSQITMGYSIAVSGGSGTTQFATSGTSAATNGIFRASAQCTVGSISNAFNNQPSLAIQQVGSPTSAAYVLGMYDSSVNLRNYTDYLFKSFYESYNVKCGLSSTYGKMGGLVSMNTTAVGNVGTGEDNLMSYSIPANILATNGDFVEFEGTITFAANGNNKRVKVKYGATTIYDSTALALNTGTLIIKGKIIRTGSSAEIITGEIISSNALIANTPFYSTATESTTAAKTLQFTGEATNNDDISQKVLIVNFQPNNT